jgi:mannose-6-phosphate isomerase-like protein (cupin superfamily)
MLLGTTHFLRRAFSKTRTFSTLPSKVNLSAAFANIKEPWDPRVAANVNNFQVKLARMEGEFVWHSHEHEDEVFLVTGGTMRMQFREGNVDVNPGELITVPKGLEHCPMAVTDHCTVVLFEPAETINTGNFDDENYIHESSKEGLSLHKTELKDV